MLMWNVSIFNDGNEFTKFYKYYSGQTKCISWPRAFLKELEGDREDVVGQVRGKPGDFSVMKIKGMGSF